MHLSSHPLLMSLPPNASQKLPLTEETYTSLRFATHKICISHANVANISSEEKILHLTESKTCFNMNFFETQSKTVFETTFFYDRIQNHLKNSETERSHYGLKVSSWQTHSLEKHV